MDIREEVIDIVELPTIVIDGEALFDHGQIIPHRVRLFRDIFEHFNLVMWKDASIVSRIINAARYKKLEELYEVDYCKVITCSLDDLGAYLAINRTVVLTDRRSVTKKCGDRAWDQFSPEMIIQLFDQRAVR